MALVGALTSNQDATSGSASVILTLPAGAAAGHDVFWATTNNVTNGVAVTLPSGHEQLATASISNNNDAVLGHKKLTAADITAGSFTVTYPSGNRAQGMGLVESGLDATTPYEVVAAGTTAAASSGTTPAGTTTVDGSAVLEFVTARSAAPNAAVASFAGTYTKVGEAKTNAATGANETVAVARIITPGVAGAYGGDTVTTSPAASNVVLFTLALRNTPTSEAHSGSAALTGSGVLSAAAAIALSAAVALSGAGSLATTGTPQASGAVSLSGSGTLAAPAAPSIAGTASLTGSGTLAAAGTPSATQAAALSGSGALTATGSSTQAGSGTATLTGAGTLAAAGQARTTSSAALTGSGALTVSAAPAAAVTVTLAGSGGLNVTSVPGVAGAAAFAGDGTLSAVGSGSQASDGRPVEQPVLTLTAHDSALTITTPGATLALPTTTPALTITTPPSILELT